jgi:hypothetical protein
LKFSFRYRFEVPASEVVFIETDAQFVEFLERLRRDDPTHPFLEQYAELDDR